MVIGGSLDEVINIAEKELGDGVSVCWEQGMFKARVAVSEVWRISIPPEVTAQNGLCARIPCNYNYPSHLINKPRTGIWNYDKNKNPQSIAFHSGDFSQASPRFHHRTWLSGGLRDGNCSLVIDNIMQEDEGSYHFRIEFNDKDSYSFHSVTRLSVSDFTDKPSIFSAEMVEGKPVTVICTFNTTCNGTAPTLSWVTPADKPSSVSHSITQWGDTLTYSSVLILTPALKHHGQKLICGVRYPTVSSEQTLTLTVQYSPQNLTITFPSNVNNSSISVKNGNSTAILCSVQSFPASNLTWRHLGVTLNRTRSSNELWLELSQVTPRLAGAYQCVAENEHGTAERAVTLTVELSATEEQRLPVIPLASAAVVAFLIILSAVICLILKSRPRTDRPPVDALGPMTEDKQRMDKAQKHPQTALNMNQLHEDIYENCQIEDSIYENV
ncbi:sialic acid-binding Ig-like lectin 13 [Rhinoraja longicauda]